MRNILFNFQTCRLKYLFKTGGNSVCLASIKCFSNFPFPCKASNAWNPAKTANFKCIYTSSSKFKNSTGSDHPEKNKSRHSLIYNGTLAYQVKGVKVFTCITSLGGIIIQPWMIQNILKGNNMPLGVAAFCCVGFFTFLTPFLIHMLTKKYVTEIWYDSATDTYAATVLSFFLQKINITFKIEDVAVPSTLPIFSTMIIKGRPVFIVSESFLEMEHYIRMMGYDKPVDMKSNLISDDLKGSQHKAKSELL